MSNQLGIVDIFPVRSKNFLCISDPLDDNAGQLLEAYIQNKTTRSPFEKIFKHVHESALGYLLEGTAINRDQLCNLCPVVFDFLALERRQGMTNIQLSGEVSYFCSIFNIESNLDVCLGVIEPIVVSFINKQKKISLFLHWFI